MKKLIILMVLTMLVFVVTHSGYAMSNYSFKAEISGSNAAASNSYPLALNDTISACSSLEAIHANVLNNDSDPDGDLLTASILMGPFHGSASIVGNEIIYTPNTNFYGSDLIMYVLFDNGIPSLSDTALLRINVNFTPIADAGLDRNICVAENIIIGSPAVAGNIYNWTPEIGLVNISEAQPQVSPLVETTYYLTVTDTITGCQQSDSVNIIISPFVEANAGNLLKMCVGKNVTLGTIGIPGYSYSWLPSESLDSANVPNPSASPLVTTIYQLTITDSISGCESIDLVEVKVYPMPVLMPSTDQTICKGDSVMIGAVQDSSNVYLWAPTGGLSASNIQQPIAKPLITTDYVISVSNPGCKVVESVTVNVINPVPANAGSDTLLCKSSSIGIGSAALDGYTYSWEPSEGLNSASVAQPIATVHSTITYTLTITNDSTGCVSKGKIKIAIDSTMTYTGETKETIVAGESVIIGTSPEYGVVYNWSPSYGLDLTSTSQVVASPTQSTTYLFTQTNTLTGCTTSSEVFVSLQTEYMCDTTVFNGFSPNDDGVDDYWNIPLVTCYPQNEVLIFNRWGQMVWKKSNYDNMNVKWFGQNMSGTNLSDGTYYFIIKHDEKENRGWVILKR